MGIKLVINENLYGYVSENHDSIPVHIDHYVFEEMGPIFPSHWHEQFMLMYIKKGELLLQCGTKKIVAEEESIAIINPNEMHSGEVQGSILEYYSMKIDLLLSFRKSVGFTANNVHRTAAKKPITI